ncbi:hypothetical protein GOBAR_AA01961 [Gossypium barbadense]|uniref:SLC41A/MgtE integral membrane domain-containing protein n=1 Tax=Gossypium barbadense TaxID=3634 RepID=A0A2P5YSV0_GOSBA|nr:hypothetical protein GOBAR_AA01961 [Gossypium barbadense]
MSPGDTPSLRINNSSSSSRFSFLMVVFLALTQGVIMAIFVICILVYAMTLCTPYFPEVIDDINLLAGSLASVLLTFTLFPALG